MSNHDIGFNAITKNMTQKNGGYFAKIPDSWRQGRTAYGGLTAGLALSAAHRAMPDLPPLRSANINYIGPVTDDPVFQTSLLRKGRNVTTVKVVGSIGDNIIVDIVFTFGNKRESLLNEAFKIKNPANPEDCEPFTPKAIEGFVPKFFLRFETQLIEGARPVSGADEGYIRAWSRHKDPASREGVTSLLTLSDVLPPAAMPMLTKFGPVSSINFLLNFVTDNPQTKDGWWQVESKMTVAQNGYSSQVMRIFNFDGELVAEGVQLVALFI